MSVRFGEEGDRFCPWRHGQTYSMVIEKPTGQGSLEEACRLMAIAPDWAKDLPLRADGDEFPFYQK